MSKLRDNHPPHQPGEDYGAWCWSALSDDYQAKFANRTSTSLHLKARLMSGYESLSRNDDVVLSAILYVLQQRGA